MTLEEILKTERSIWGNDPTLAADIAVHLGVVFGDICRELRDFRYGRGRLAGNRQLQKELGNILTSTLRLIDDLGYDAGTCINLAFEAQRNFRKKEFGTETAEGSSPKPE